MATNAQLKEHAENIGYVATAILAYLDMGNEEEVTHILETMDRGDLGMVISTWYQLCVAHRTAEVTSATARKTAEFFVEIAKEDEEDIAQFSRALLIHLADNKLDRYAKKWQEVISYEPDITLGVSARILGFAQGILGELPGPDCD